MATGVLVDVDGDTRPGGCFPDLGADEVIVGVDCKRVYLPVIRYRHQLPAMAKYLALLLWLRCSHAVRGADTGFGARA